MLTNLRPLKAAGKPVLVIDYPKSKKKIESFFERVKAEGLIGYAPDRELKTLGRTMPEP